jgi:hypothetical protein
MAKRSKIKRRKSRKRKKTKNSLKLLTISKSRSLKNSLVKKLKNGKNN